MAYDSGRHATVLMGGVYDPSTPQLAGNETWELIAVDTPFIKDQPASQYRQPGDTALFTVMAAGPPGASLSYAWYYEGQALVDGARGGRIAGATSATLQIANVALADAGHYSAQVSCDCGRTESLGVTLFLDAKLRIFVRGGAGRLIWSASNMALEQGDSVTGPWTVVPGASSPFEITALESAKFFRLAPAGP